MTKKAAAEKQKVQTRAPVVTIMGHVDHGKTSLLDFIRKSNVAAGESGGITQHIGAYQVEINGKKITFIDTPGHAAFSAMRSRGAAVTDIVVLVVAADDGVMPQTKESIAHIKAAKVPMIVAINKMDVPGANLDRVKKGLATEGVLVEGYGGDVVSVPISAKTGEGVKDLLEMIQLVSELEELSSEPKAEFEAVVIDSSLDRFKGPVATILVKQGVLRRGDQVVAGEADGRVKALISFEGKKIDEAGPSTPVEVLGLTAVPVVGEILRPGISKGEKTRQALPEKDVFAAATKEIRLLLKADTAGSLEAVDASISEIKAEDGKVVIVHKETGDVTDSDVLLASATKALIIAFGVQVSKPVSSLAEEEKVLVRSYSLIYELLDELKEGIDALLNVKKEELLGKAEIVASFKGESGKIAGARVTEGRLTKGDRVNLVRDERKIGSGKIKTMKHLQEDINSASEGQEFGVQLEGKLDFAIGDIIEAVK
jgi:translation initiation factor IF-2